MGGKKALLRYVAGLCGLLLVVLLGVGGWRAWDTALAQPDDRFAEIVEYARGYSEFVVTAEPELWEVTRPDELAGVESEVHEDFTGKFASVRAYRISGDQLALYLEYTWERVYGGWWQRWGAAEDDYVFLQRLSVAVELDMMAGEGVGESSWEAFIPFEARESYDCYPNCLEQTRDVVDNK